MLSKYNFICIELHQYFATNWPRRPHNITVQQTKLFTWLLTVHGGMIYNASNWSPVGVVHWFSQKHSIHSLMCQRQSREFNQASGLNNTSHSHLKGRYHPHSTSVRSVNNQHACYNYRTSKLHVDIGPTVWMHIHKYWINHVLMWDIHLCTCKMTSTSICATA